MTKQFLIGVSLAVVLSSLVWGQVIPDEPEKLPALPRPELGLDSGPGQILLDDVQQAGNPAQPDVWVGLGVESVSDALRAHIDLPDGTGLVVREVVPDGPAAAAGIQRHDILLGVNGKALSNAADLIQAVRGSNGKTINLEWQRRGQSHVAEVVPAPRPPAVAPRDASRGGIPGIASPDRVRDWLKGLQQGIDDPDGVRVRIFGENRDGKDGTTSSKSASLNNLSIQIQKQGDEPAKITVKRDGDSWEITEDTLDELPDDIRPQVERMVKGNGISIRLQDGFPIRGFELPQLPQIDMSDFDRRFEEMNRRMEQMMNQMRKLEDHHVPAKPDVDLDEA